MKFIMCSTVFPAYHAKKGKSTYFNNRILNGLMTEPLAPFDAIKIHTIRSGTRWKVGDSFNPRIWKDRPYRSKTVQICEPLTVQYTIPFVFDGEQFYIGPSKQRLLISELTEIAWNDGLSPSDFKNWFNKPFDGQIIGWTKCPYYSLWIE